MPPPRLPMAPEFHAIVRAEIDPVERRLRYKPKSSGATGGWHQDGRGKVFFGFQLDRKAVDAYAGGRFIIEFERTVDGVRFRKLAGRARFSQLLTGAELETAVEYQDQVIASLPRPPASHIALYPQDLQETYLSWFKPKRAFPPGGL